MKRQSKLLSIFRRIVYNYMERSGIVDYEVAERELIENYCMSRTTQYVGDLNIREEIASIFG